MKLKPGTRLQSVTCSTQVIVVAAPAEDVELCCRGAPMTADLRAPAALPVDPSFAGGAPTGKRFTDGSGVAVLVTKAGDGSLSIGDRPLEVQEPRRLPSSD